MTTPDILPRLRSGGLCGDPCKVMDARSGCACAEAADEIEAVRAHVETLTADLTEARRQRDEQKSYTIQGDDLRRELFADIEGERARALTSDTARASAETALRPFADFAARIATERPGWDHDAFELFRASSPDIDQDWLLLTMAPFRRARAALEPRT